MSKITPIITALPFYKLPTTYTATGAAPLPFYFQKKQCITDCTYGTITDRKHLPSFIVQIPIETNPLLLVKHSTNMDFEIMCADGTNITTIIPVYRFTVKAFVSSAAELALIAAQPTPPTIGDTYYYDTGLAGSDVELMVWDGATFNGTGQLVPLYNDLMEVTDEGFVYAWTPDPDSTDPNAARRGTWEKTLNGFQLCDIGDFTYLIYNGFEVEDLPCGIQQLRIEFPDMPIVTNTGIFISELVDIRDFNSVNNEYHKLTIDNSCALGNIPYEDVRFSQIYYFAKDGLVGIPEYNIDETQEEDGLGNKKKIFSRTEKLFTLDTQWIPEYIVDFLQFATVHSDIRITFPFDFSSQLNLTSQYQGERCIDNDTMTAESNWMEVGCYSQVLLKFALEDSIIKTACCQQLDKQGCIESSYDIQIIECYDQQEIIEAIPPSVGDCFLIKPLSECPACGGPCNDWYDHPDEIACWTVEGEWEYTEPIENTIITDLSTGNEWFWSAASGWKIMNSAESVSATSSTITINGYILTTILSGYLYYRVSGQVTWTNFGVFTSAELAAGITITGLICEENYEIQILGLSNNCDYGLGEILATGTGVC